MAAAEATPAATAQQQGPSSFEWTESSSGKWQRPLTASEERWDAFHRDAPTAWTDFCSSVSIDVQQGAFASETDCSKIERWAEQSIGHVLLRAPLLMGRIEFDQKQKYYRYDSLSSVEEVNARVKQLLHVTFTDDVQGETDRLSSAYYADKKRVSVELGPALIKFVFVASTKGDGQFALFLQTTHTLIDFWALASLFELALDAFSNNEPLRFTPKQDIGLLSPAYLEVMNDPPSIDYYNPDEAEKEHAGKIMGALLQNPLGLRIERAAPESNEAKANVDTMTIKHVFTPETTAAIVKQAKAHGRSVNEVIQAAHIAALQAVSPVPADNTVRTHAPSGILNLLPRTKLLKNDKQTTLTPSHQPFMGALMVPYVCDIGPLLDVPQDVLQKDSPTKQRSDAFWYVAKAIGEEYRKSQSASAPLKAFWDKGPALWGGFVDMLPAVYAGAIPSPPAVYPPLSNAGVLDQNRHLRAGNEYKGAAATLRLANFAFYPRVSPLFGTMSWAWTIGGQLHTQACLPDPREANTPDAPAWFAKSNELLQQVAQGVV